MRVKDGIWSFDEYGLRVIAQQIKVMADEIWGILNDGIKNREWWTRYSEKEW
jgi:hypothetical protein